jgi:hypothetical protein
MTRRVPGGDVTGGDRLARIRGASAPQRLNARAIAALAGNPGCHRRAVLDSAGVDKQRLASHVGFPARFGQSQFAISRGNAFEAQVKANGCAELLRLLREVLGLSIPEVAYDDLASGAGQERQDVRYARTRQMLVRAVEGGDWARTLFDHPLLRLDVAGQPVYLEPDLIAFQIDGRFHIVEIKSFAVIDGQADPSKVSAAAIQAAVYVLAMRQMAAELGHDPEIVSHEVVLVCPKDFANQPVAHLIDVRKQLAVLRRQLSRMEWIDNLLAGLPPDLTFDLVPDASGTPTRDPADLTDALCAVPARYAPECLATCELAYFCRHEARGRTAVLGRAVREELGGVETVVEVLALATGMPPADDHQAEVARLLQTAARLRAEALS